MSPEKIIYTIDTETSGLPFPLHKVQIAMIVPPFQRGDRVGARLNKRFIYGKVINTWPCGSGNWTVVVVADDGTRVTVGSECVSLDVLGELARL